MGLEGPAYQSDLLETAHKADCRTFEVALYLSGFRVYQDLTSKLALFVDLPFGVI